MLRINNYSSDILHNINLEIKSNTVILGANGSGKSTLAKVISGLIKSKNISFKDNFQSRVEIINYIPAKLEIFDEYLSVEEFLLLSCIHSDTSNINKIVDILDINHLLKNSCKSLSSGESQLLLLASAFIHNAHITILDEPSANLDQIKTKQIFQLLKNDDYLKTKIIITHDLNFAKKLGFDVVYLKDGKIEFKGGCEEFFSNEKLEYFFKNSVKKIDEFIVGNL